MKIFKKEVKPTVIAFNLFTLLVTVLTLLTGAFTDNKELLESILTPEAMTGLVGFMGVVSAILQKVGKPKPPIDEPDQKE